MAKIEFPRLLKQLLEESCLQAPVRALADQIGNILSDNKLPFFPDYTDHGIDHVNRVLQFEVELVPKTVWEKSQNNSDPRLLCDADAAVIICATLLHDIAMHLRENGFRELVSSDSRFKPLPWFNDAHEGHADDLPWHELWEEYVREAKRFSERDLAKIIGEKEARAWKFDQLPDEIGQWGGNHYLIIGEFIRRHHARLAHEIAIYGFPGLPVGSGEHQFPAMGKEKGHLLGRLADLIGLTARSHGMNLRTCKSFLDSKYPGTPRPMGTAVLYPMALLRVADYFQIDRQRAPAVLLQLRNPQSPVSVQEWKKHLAVQDIGPATDPRGKMVTVRADICLSLYLQLQQLLKDMQAEMDHSTAVLDEAYGTRNDLGLDQLNLSIRRVYSNMDSPAFRDNLPYVPERAGFCADPILLPLLVEPLYGKNPSVGVRELMQNAVDAVCELDAWSKTHGVSLESLDLPEQDGDVLIDFIEREDRTWFLRVRDRGIGMTSDTIKNYFLRAGASFRNSEEWMKEFIGDDGKPRVARAGRFGIGVFAVFLLGPSFRLWTRHAGADNSEGYMIGASADSQLIEIQRVDNLPVGTTVEVEMIDEPLNAFGTKDDVDDLFFGGDIFRLTDWFCWNWPVVLRRVVRGPDIEILKQKYVLPVRRVELPPEWSEIKPSGFDSVYWMFGDSPRLSCNGLIIIHPSPYRYYDIGFQWPEDMQLKNPPSITVLDSAANLPLTIQRYELSQRTVPFIEELIRDVTLSFIAYCLVCAPASCTEALSSRLKYPLYQHNSICTYDEYDNPMDGPGWLSSQSLLTWCMTSSEIVPSESWLYSLLNVESCVVNGVLSFSDNLFPVLQTIGKHMARSNCAMMSLSGQINLWKAKEENTQRSDQKELFTQTMFYDLAHNGVVALGHNVQATRVLISAENELFQFDFILQEIRCTGSRTWFEVKKGILDSSYPLDELLGEMETITSDLTNSVLYVAEIKTARVERQPESLIAKLWKECLGARAIPFDPVAREAMIADGCEHPELKRHIEAWQEMKRTGSKWVTGE